MREAHVYSEIVPHTITAEELAARRPRGLILSGGPKSVHVPGAPTIDPMVYEAGVPVLGICYGAQLIAQQLGGEVSRTGKGEYGRTDLEPNGESSVLLEPEHQVVWMSHFDSIVRPPQGFRVTASTPEAPVAVLEHVERRIHGVQFHPEVVHTANGQALLRRFLYDVCGCEPTWTMASVIDTSIEQIRAQVGDERVICGLSGGVDSSVAAALVHRAVGPQLTCVFVDTGLLRKGEAAQVVETFHRHQGIELIHVDASERFFERLAGVTDPEEKRKAIGELFIRVFEEHTGGLTDARFLVQGTLYPDVIESGHGPRRGDQEPPQRRRPARRHGPGAGRAAAQPVQGRGPQRRHRARAARRDRVAPALPRAGAGGAHRGRRVAREGRRSSRRPTPSCGRRSGPPGSSARSGRPSRCCSTSARSA